MINSLQHRLYAIVPAAGATQAQPAHSLSTLCTKYENDKIHINIDFNDFDFYCSWAENDGH
jgi:hypothetical protein